MPCRYTRDEIIKIAINQARLPNLEVHDCPEGVVQQDAYAIEWVQSIVDFWFHMMPFSSTVIKVDITCIAHSDSITLPTDFIIDVRNGLLVQTVLNDSNSYKRRRRLPLQKFINRQETFQGAVDVHYPLYYCIAGDNGDTQHAQQTMLITPTPTISTLCKLWYYKLPPVLDANQSPKLPSDYVAIEYVRLRALEWSGIFEPGTAQKFCDKIVSGMKAAGLMNETEDDEIPFDDEVYIRRNTGWNNYSWMGPR